MSIKDLKITRSEVEGDFIFEPKDRLKEIAAGIFLDYQEKLRKEILNHLTDEEIQELIKEDDENLGWSISLLTEAQTELRLRKTLARAKEVGVPYCVYHDCQTKDCPEWSHE